MADGKDTLKKLLKVLFRIILTPSICCGNTSGDKQSRAVRSKTQTALSSSAYSPLLIVNNFRSVHGQKHVAFIELTKCPLHPYSSIPSSMVTPSVHLSSHTVSLTYLCNSCEESESCPGWVSGHLSSPTVGDCPSEQDVRPSEREGGPWRKANSDGLDQKTKPKRCPCGDNTFYKMLRDKEEHTITL